jgi:hypothetical protein
MSSQSQEAPKFRGTLETNWMEGRLKEVFTEHLDHVTPDGNTVFEQLMNPFWHTQSVRLYTVKDVEESEKKLIGAVADKVNPFFEELKTQAAKVFDTPSNTCYEGVVASLIKSYQSFYESLNADIAFAKKNRK